jgi:hypothetical protein
MQKMRLWRVDVDGLVDADHNPLSCVYLKAEDEVQIWRIFKHMWIENTILNITPVDHVPKDGYFCDYWRTAGVQ